jgi:AraC-like DNA-binding protein
VRQASDIGEFLAAPVGRWVRGRRFVVWCHAPNLVGSLHWGRAEAEDMQTFLRAIDVAGAPGVRPPLDVLVDVRRAELPDAAAFGATMEHVRDHWARYVRPVKRSAFIHASNLSAAAATGFWGPIAPDFELRLFGDPAEGFGWFARPDGAAAATQVAELTAETFSEAPMTLALRAHLAGESTLKKADIAAAGRALGVSSRSLQRRLEEEGTSFRNELARARIDAALPLVRDGEIKLDAVARMVGCSSLAAFSRLYRRMTGESPSQARARGRRPAGQG